MTEQAHKKHVEEGEVLDEKPTTNSHAAPNRPVIVQSPNKPLIIAIVAFILAGPLPGVLGTFAYILGIIALGRWSFLEVERGANGIRRFLGWLGCMLTLYLVIHLVFY